jgi:hypothetical protein
MLPAPSPCSPPSFPASPMRSLVALCCVACLAPADSPAPPSDPTPVLEAITAQLELSVQQAAKGDAEAAVTSWAVAHEQFETTLTPWLEARESAMLGLQLDYGLGRVRDELRRRRGRPGERVEVWLETLREVVNSAPEPRTGV